MHSEVSHTMSAKVASAIVEAPSTPRKEKSREPFVVTPSSKNVTPKRKAKQTPKSEVKVNLLTDDEASDEEPKEFKKEFPVFVLEEELNESPSKKRVGHRISDEVDHVYRVVNKKTGALGGNGYTGAIYGELTIGSMHKVAEYLAEECEMGVNSCFIDVGSGLGKPNFHVLHYPGVRLSIGVELEQIRWQLAMHNLDYYLETYREQTSQPDGLQLNREINFIESDIDIAQTMDPFTHIYMYDLGFPPPLQQSIARKFNRSVHARYLVSYRPPRRVLDEYGYDVEYMHSMITSMFGSGEGHTAYFYKRTASSIASAQTQAKKTQKTTRKSSEDEDDTASSLYATKVTLAETTRFGNIVPEMQVHCDPAFLEHVRMACADDQGDSLFAYASHCVREHLNSPRPKRTPRPSSKLAF